MGPSLHSFIVAALLASLLPSAASAGNGSTFKLAADLFGDSNLSGHAVYVEKGQRRQGLDRRFNVRIQGAQPGDTFEVIVADIFVGTATANEAGRAQLKYRTRSFIEDVGDERPMPMRFPRLQAGDAIIVGPLSGVFYEESRRARARAQWYRLRGDLNGDAWLEGNVRYIERLRKGRLLRRFKVRVEDAEPGDVMDVLVNGVFVGEVVVDDVGEGELELRTAAFIDGPDDGEPMPDAFPSLVPGDLVEVGPLESILTAN